MPTIGEILTDIDNARYPNTFTAAQKIVWANEILRKVYKYTNRYTGQVFTTTADQSTYTFDGVFVENIIKLKVNFQEYKFMPTLERVNEDEYYYSGLNDSLGIYPTPTKSGLFIEIYYVPVPTLLSESDLTSKPAIKEDYHSLITNYVCMTAASSGPNPDTEMANIFAIRFNEDWDRFITDWAKTKVNMPSKKYCNRWW